MKKRKGLKIAGAVIVVLVVFVSLMLFVANWIYYMGIKSTIHVELGEELPKAGDFLKDVGDIEYITDISKIDEDKEGKHQVKIRYNGKEKKVFIIIEDTLAPEVLVKDMDISIYETLKATDLVVRVSDESKVKIEYKKKPDFGTVGEYKAVIRVKDEAGNETLVTSVVNVCRVKEYVEYKYGEAFPDVSSFIFSEKDSGKLLTNLETTVKKPGTYYVAVEIEGKTYKSKLIAIDNEPPVVVGRDGEISYEEIEDKKSLMPNEFVQSFYDKDDVEIYFLETPDYTGKQQVPVSVAVTDASGNTTIINKILYVVEHKGMDFQVGSGELTNNDLTRGLECVQASFVSGNVDTNKLGRYPIVVDVDGTQKNVFINVVDMDAPKATPVQVVLETKQDIVPEMFVTDVKDTTAVNIEFDREPDKSNRQVQNVRVKLTDEAGNFTYIDTTLSILYDAVEPELTGVANVTTYIRQKPDYLLGVTAVDDVDGNVQVLVDDSKVDYEKSGIYEVVYSAADASGNVVTWVTNVEVKNITRPLVDSMADQILAEITNESMTKDEKAWAVFTYIKDNVRYINQADQSSTEKAAYDGLTLGVGDCFTYASLVEVFIERIGGQTIFVSRDSMTSNHYWELCNLGTGWYHMDVTPRDSSFVCFMKTDAEIFAESQHYWAYDKSLYPAVATEVYGQ